MHFVRPFSIRATLAGLALCVASCSVPSLGQPHYQEPLRQAVDTGIGVVQITVRPEPAPPKATVKKPAAPKPASTLWMEEAGSADLVWKRNEVSDPARAEVVVDFGVGEVPYDDGTEEYRLDYRPVRGFSDALVQLELRSHLEPGFSVHGIAALNRVQDETLMEALNEGDWAWFGVGVQFSW